MLVVMLNEIIQYRLQSSKLANQIIHVRLSNILSLQKFCIQFENFPLSRVYEIDLLSSDDEENNLIENDFSSLRSLSKFSLITLFFQLIFKY